MRSVVERHATHDFNEWPSRNDVDVCVRSMRHDEGGRSISQTEGGPRSCMGTGGEEVGRRDDVDLRRCRVRRSW